ncbi:MAG: arginine--tRNA ligase [Candidatus Marinimicrobia bacterium]|nr:arginine--tRNA ligase [Candidatus Neomarinimicrobiota bacterium]
MKDYLSQKLNQALTELDLPSVDFQLAPTKNPQFGDLSTNLALILAKQAKQNPIELANKLKSELDLDNSFVREVSVTPPGFINFTFSNHYLFEALNDVLNKGVDYGKSDMGTGQSANVEFVSANPTGPLTVGHGRQSVLGDTVGNILQWHGYNVTREYYYNDAGRQMRILGQSVAARYFQELGKDIALPEDGYQGSYIKDIAKSIIVDQGQELTKESPLFRELAEKTIFSDIRESLKQIGIVHDQFTNEKTFYESGAIDDIVESLKKKDLVYESEGASWFRTTALGKEQDRVLIKSSGEPTYRLPDIAYHRNKLDRKFDLVVDIFGADHQDTYPDVLSALEALDYDVSSIRVLIHQFVTLIRSGEVVKMSTRKANFVTLDELTNLVGKDVVRYFFIMRGMNSHLNFDLDLAQDQSEKNPVYYLQYAHARIVNILKHGEHLDFKYSTDFNAERLTHDSELTLLKSIGEFPDIMAMALKSLEPQLIANYLHGLAGHFHRFYSDCRVITDDKELSQARLALIFGAKTVIANGLSILGVNAPDRM